MWLGPDSNVTVGNIDNNTTNEVKIYVVTGGMVSHLMTLLQLIVTDVNLMNK